VYRLNAQKIAVTTPAQDLTHQTIKNELLQITLNNTYHSSKKIYGVQAAAVDFGVASEYMRLSALELAEAWNVSALTALITEAKGRTVLHPTQDQFNVKSAILSAKTQLYKSKARGSVVICSPEFYQLILEAAGNSFTPTINDRMVYSGDVGSWLGLTFINSNLLQSAAGPFEYYDYTSTKKDVLDIDSVDFIMYDPMAFSILINFNESRFINSENFFGTLAQVEMNSGFRVTQPESVLVATHQTYEGYTPIADYSEMASKTTRAAKK
jgi:hypothetical protein